MSNNVAFLEKLSVQAHLVELFNEFDILLGSGTCFFGCIDPQGAAYLITNRHLVTGRKQTDNQPLWDHGGIPKYMKIHFLTASADIAWQAATIDLVSEDGSPPWLEHPTLGALADFVCFRMDMPTGLKAFPFDVSEPERPIRLLPAEAVTIVGFPFHASAGGYLGIWVTGFLASEMVVDWGNLPRFLVDSRTREGQSGSPVVAVRRDAVSFADGGVFMGHLHSHEEFLGIYSGRINRESDLGIVWKRSALAEMISFHEQSVASKQPD